MTTSETVALEVCRRYRLQAAVIVVDGVRVYVQAGQVVHDTSSLDVSEWQYAEIERCEITDE